MSAKSATPSLRDALRSLLPRSRSVPQASGTVGFAYAIFRNLQIFTGKGFSQYMLFL
jgi:rhamnogalacturonyl hydrolase YesR